MNTQDASKRLEYLRGEIRAERISYGEIAELQGLVPYINPDDTELLEWAGVDEEDRPVIAIAARRRAGVDNTQDESAVVKRYFDRYTTEAEAELDDLAGLFPLEFAEWCEDVDRGVRPS